MSTNDTILEVKDLQTYFFNRRGVTKAVDGISFSLRQGETLGIVGESGCGKTMTALSLLGADYPGRPRFGAIEQPGDAASPRAQDLHDSPGPADLFEPSVLHRKPGN